MKNYFIIEDEHNAASRLERLISGVNPAMKCLGVAASIAEAVELFQQPEQAEIAFMDIELADGSSFEIFDKIKIDIPVIFTTAYDQYALEAFKKNGFDYLLKPIKVADLERAIQKISVLKNRYSESKTEIENNYTTSFLLKLGLKLIQVSIEDIVCFFVDSRVVCVLTKEGKEIPINQSLEKLQEELDPATFFRINRKIVVNKSAIQHIQTATRSRLLLQFEVNCPTTALVATEKVSAFKQWMQQ